MTQRNSKKKVTEGGLLLGKQRSGYFNLLICHADQRLVAVEDVDTVSPVQKLMAGVRMKNLILGNAPRVSLLTASFLQIL